MSNRWWLKLAVIGWILAPAAGLGASEPPIPEAKSPGSVIDLAGLLSPADVAALGSLGEQVKTRQGAELVILTVRSTGGENPRALAVETFNRWQLGNAARDNGLLLFVASDDHAAEIVLGAGIGNPAQVAQSERILQQEMVPLFRRGQNAAAIVAGARACAAEFFGIATPPAEAPLVEPAPHPPASTSGFPFFKLLLGVSAGLLFLLALRVPLKDWWQKVRPRPCAHCGGKLRLLEESLARQQLSPSENLEMQLRSVAHQVWSCSNCGAVEKQAQRDRWSAYQLCGQCGSYTVAQAKTVLEEANVSSHGTMEISSLCHACGHQLTTTEVIPLLTPPSPATAPPASPSPWSRHRHDRHRHKHRSPPKGSSGGGRTSGGGSSARW